MTEPRTSRPCSYPDCPNRQSARGYCSAHYSMWRTGRQLRPLQVARDVTVRDAEGNKECISCDTWLPESDFGVAQHTRDRLTVHCLLCQQVRRYNITRRVYEDMFVAQRGVCAICTEGPEPGKSLHIDHDHSCCPAWGRSCGECIRGLLCSECNKGLGQFHDNIWRLAKAAVYLYTRSAA